MASEVIAQFTKEYRVHLAGSGRSPNTVNKYLSGLELIWRVLGEQENHWKGESVGREVRDTAGREADT